MRIGIAGCAGPSGANDPAVDDLTRGRRLYVARCARCHKLYDPGKYSAAEWRSWMDKMSRKAKLKADQEELISRYVDTLRRPADHNDERDGNDR